MRHSSATGQIKSASAAGVGELLREWRIHRRLSQLNFAYEAGISPRHLSFVETGRSQPSREMILRLAEALAVPLRERNVLLLAAGYAPEYPERPLDAPALDAARRAMDLVLSGHEPYPALAVDRHWTMFASNKAVSPLLTGVAPFLLRAPVNALRLSLHPDGLAPRIINLRQWRAHLLDRLYRQVNATADPTLTALLQELKDYPSPELRKERRETDKQTIKEAVCLAQCGEERYGGFVAPLRLATDFGPLTLFSTTTVFGAPADVTLSEIALESFFPADPASAAILCSLANAKGACG